MSEYYAYPLSLSVALHLICINTDFNVVLALMKKKTQVLVFRLLIIHQPAKFHLIFMTDYPKQLFKGTNTSFDINTTWRVTLIVVFLENLTIASISAVWMIQSERSTQRLNFRKSKYMNNF